MSVPVEADGRVIPPKKYSLQRRTERSKVKGYLHVYAAFVPDPTENSHENDSSNGTMEETYVADTAQPAFTSRPRDSSAITTNASTSSRRYGRKYMASFFRKSFKFSFYCTPIVSIQVTAGKYFKMIL